MKCTQCKNEAVCLIPIYANNNLVLIYEGRCREHKNISKGEKRLIRKEFLKKTMICKRCNQRYGVEGVDYWSIRLGVCDICVGNKHNRGSKQSEPDKKRG